MAKAVKTPDKRLKNLRPGKNEKTKQFSSDYQPSPEAKKKGWQQLRSERHLSQAIVKEMLGINGKPTKSFKSYINALIINAKAGNAKAIEAVNKYIEDDIQLLSLVDPDGKPVQMNINLSNGEKVSLH